MTNKRVEFGDFQTPYELAVEVARLVKSKCHDFNKIVEPNCGLGSFVKAAMDVFGETPEYYGFDVNRDYVKSLKNEVGSRKNCHIECVDFFIKNWEEYFKKDHTKWLVIGNPPWVTNSVLGILKSDNLPAKSNFKKLEGFAAKTGKANFDITEWMLIKLIKCLFGTPACIAMLCKTSTARKVLRYFWNLDACIYDSSIHKIDAAKYFNVSVDACLFMVFTGKGKSSKDSVIYDGLTFDNKLSHLGMINNELISNVDLYNKYCAVDGKHDYGWRSGIKHDASKVMELEKIDEKYINGFNEIVELEDKYIYPLLKSSDIGNQRTVPRKYVVVTQKKVGDDTICIRNNAPKTWKYLEKYSCILDCRESIIYKKRPRFSIFGIGDYSFSPWKVAISGFYKNIVFSVVGEKNKKPIMLDDTCYFLPCESKEAAFIICDILSSEYCRGFITSLLFLDSKRPINIDILKRIDLKKLAKLNRVENVEDFLYRKKSTKKLLFAC